MKFPYYDPTTKKEYECENEYEFKIKSFIEAKQYNFFDDEVIAYALSIKDELINELDKNSSKSDKIKVEHIRWIEKYLDGIHDFLIQKKLKIPTTLEKNKKFSYPAGNRQGGRPKGYTERTINRYKKVFLNFTNTKKKFSSKKNSELYELISTIDYDGKTYSRNTIKNIIEEKKYNLKASR